MEGKLECGWICAKVVDNSVSLHSKRVHVPCIWVSGYLLTFECPQSIDIEVSISLQQY